MITPTKCPYCGTFAEKQNKTKRVVCEYGSILGTILFVGMLILVIGMILLIIGCGEINQ